MTKQEKITTVKDLLNQVVVLCGTNKDEFLAEVSETVQGLLTEKEKPEVPEGDYYDSEDYYDSNC